MKIWLKYSAAKILSFSMILFPLLFHSCYSSKNLQKDPIQIATVQKTKQKIDPQIKIEKRELADLAGVTSNNVFMDIDGVPEYRIGISDVLAITSYLGDKSTETTTTVNSRGKISFSFLDDLDVVGLTPSQLDLLLTKKLSKFLRTPRIDIIVKEYNSKSVTIVGEINTGYTKHRNLVLHTGEQRSKKIFLKGKTNLIDLIPMMGGFSDNADLKNVKILRKGKKYRVNIYDILEKGDGNQNIILDNNDIINIPGISEYREKIYIMGEVYNQGIYSLENSKTLVTAISSAGNVTPLANEETILIIRGYGSNSKPVVMVVNLKTLSLDINEPEKILLKDSDLIYIPDEPIDDIEDWINHRKLFFDFILSPNNFSSYYKNRYLLIKIE